MIPVGLMRFAPYVIAAGVAFGLGWSAAWYVQGMRLTAAKQELVEWQQGMTKAVQAAREHEYQLNVEAQNAWSKNLDELRRTWRNGWVPNVPNGSGATVPLPAASGVDAACAGPISVARTLAQELSEAALRCNAIQSRIESQEGY